MKSTTPRTLCSTLSSSRTPRTEKESTYNSNKTGSNALALPQTPVFSANLHELDETVKGMNESSE